MPENIYSYLDGAATDPARQRKLNALPNGISEKSIIRFPSTLGDKEHSIPFTIFMPYKRKSLLQGGGFYSVENQTLYQNLPSPTFAIALPTPTSALKTTYQATYNSIKVGQALGAAGVAGLNQIPSIIKAEGFVDTAAASLKMAGSMGVAAGSVLAAGALQGVASLIGADKEVVNIAAGAADNPFTENMFQNVEFREHSFAYTFMPKNPKDSEHIDRIVTLFKYGMLPKPATVGIPLLGAAGAGFLEFPYEFQITHSSQDTTFTLLPSVLTTLEVDYGGGADSPKLFRPGNFGEQYPAKITLSMTFKEMVLLTRDRVMYDGAYKDEPDVIGAAKRYRF